MYVLMLAPDFSEHNLFEPYLASENLDALKSGKPLMECVGKVINHFFMSPNTHWETSVVNWDEPNSAYDPKNCVATGAISYWYKYKDDRMGHKYQDHIIAQILEVPTV